MTSRVAASTSSALHAVLSAVAKTAARLCEARDAQIALVEGDHLRHVVHYGLIHTGRTPGETYPLGPGTPIGHALSERRIVHIRDMARAVRTRYPEMAAIRGRSGSRTVLAAPLLRDGTPVGGIVIRRRVVRPFTAKQIALLKTFADQAALAIENVRLFTELQERNRQLSDALEQQTTTSEILRVISRSPTDIQPVLDAVAESAARLCDAYDVIIFRREGDVLRPAAHTGPILVPAGFVVPATRSRVTGRATMDRQPVHIADAQVKSEEFPETQAFARAQGFRTILSVPLLREGVAVGTIDLRRTEMQPFTDKQIALLQTFADQAVIAIENVRLFTELQARNRELTEALEQQTATGDILTVISRSPTDVQPVFDAIAANAVRLCGAVFGCVFRFDGELLHFVAQHQFSPKALEVMKRRYPLPPTGLNAPVIWERTVVHSPDVLSDPRSANPDLVRALGYRSFLAVPMLREGQPIGSITVFGAEPRPFSDKQSTLLQTFAAQAVIAVENVRLFNELEARNRDLTEALEQQTATADILRVISSSPTNLQPVFDTILANATTLCAANLASLWLYDGENLIGAAHHNASPEFIQFIRDHPQRPSREGPLRRAAFERQVVHVVDLMADPSFKPQTLHLTEQARTVLAVPLLRESTLIGVIGIWRRQVEPFTDAQIALVKTFADQAVIAIENVRLFTELQASNRDLTEALEQQTATSEILRVISRSPTEIQPVLDAVAANASRVCGATDAIIMRVEGADIRRVAHFGPIPLVLPEVRRIADGSAAGQAILECRPIHVRDVLAADVTRAHPETVAAYREGEWRTTLAVPLVREGVAIGAIVIRRAEVLPFTEKQIQLLETFADQAVIAIENVRLFTELQARNRDLTEALEQQTATGEILRAISSSPTDAQPVFETIVRSAVRLCGARFGNVFRLEGEVVHLAAVHNHPLPALEQFRNTFPQPLSQGGTITAEAMRRGVVVHIHDLELQAEVAPAVRELSRSAGYRSALAVPILRKGAAVGAIGVGRSDATGAPRPFSDKEVQLLRTFADQAVIAIENVRLFNELQARTRDLTRSVEQLRALSDVSQAVSSTLDLNTLLTIIVARANQLAGTDGCTVYEYDEQAEEFRFRATHNQDEGLVAIARARPIRKGEGVVGRLAITREPVQIPDILAEGAYESPFRVAVVRSGARALLALPLERLERGGPASPLGEEQLIGALAVTRKTPGEFPTATIDLLKTFATQSALAIHNARLFREIEDQSRQLEVASRHKSQFLANMSHELRTPLNAILGYTELIGDNIYGEVPEKMREVVERVEKSGRHLLGLINDILDLSKIEAGQLTLALNEYAMQDVVRSVAAATEPLARAKGLGLEVAVPDDLPIGRADERRLMQVLLNLVGNAIKFTEAGKVAIRAEVTDDDFRVAVADTGPGIAEGDREKIFEEFQQADSVVARAKGGTGLGLAIARRIIEMHGGRLWLESMLGVGSTFSFTVPVRVEQQVAAPRRPAS